MKKLIFLLLLAPVFAHAQKFEITEQAGACTANAVQDYYLDHGNKVNGFSNQVSVGYHFTKNIALNAFYQYNGLNRANNSYGLSPEFTSKYFFAGIDIMTAMFASAEDNSFMQAKYKQSLGYGMHAGSKQRLWKRIFLVEQIGYDIMKVEGTLYTMPDIINAGTPSTEYTHPFKQNIHVAYARIGLAYRF